MRRLGIFASIVVAVLLLSGCRNPLTGEIVTTPFFEKAPQEVLQEMQRVMTSQRAARSESQVNLEATGGTAPLTGATLAQVLTVDADASAQLRLAVQNDTALGLAGVSYRVASESRFVDGKNYFRFTQVPLLPILNLQTVKDVWFVRELSADLTGLQSDLRLDEATLQTLLPKIQDEFSNATLFTVEERLADEAVNGVTSYHYRVKLNEDGVKAFSRTAFGILGQASSTFQGKTFPEAPADEFLASLRDARIELSIGKEDFRLNRVSISGNVEQGSEQLTYSVVTTFSRFGESVTVSVPEGAKPADEFSKLLDTAKLNDTIKQFLPMVSGTLTPEQIEELEKLF